MRALGEADRILTIFSRERGKQSVVAKGVRKTHSKFGGRLDFFNRSRITLHVGRSLDVITGAASVKEVWARLVEPQAYLLVSYAAELVDALCEPDMPVPHLYGMLCELQTIVGAGAGQSALMPAVDLRLLETLGLAPELDACATCGARLGNRPLSRGLAAVSPNAGGLVCQVCMGSRSVGDERPASDGAFMVKSSMLARLRALRALSFAEAVRDGAGTLNDLRPLTHAFIQYHLGRRSKAVSSAMGTQ